MTYTYFCYNSLGERNLTVSDMNLNSQIDCNDTDRIVSNDTRYVSLNGDWWRGSSASALRAAPSGTASSPLCRATTVVTTQNPCLFVGQSKVDC